MTHCFVSILSAYLMPSQARQQVLWTPQSTSDNACPIGPLKKCDDSLALSDKEKAGLMNSFFANIGTNIAAKLPIPTGNATTAAYRSTLGDTSPPLLSRVEISPQRIRRKVNELTSNKSTGPDCLSSKLLKLAGDDIVPSMYRLFDASIESESLYSSCKNSKAHTDL